MSAHTPGPWHYKPHVADSNYMLIFCSSDQHEGDNLRGYCGEANARLIAAAPDLLAALKAILSEVDGPEKPYSSDSWLPAHLVKAACSATAKAEGRE